MVRSMLYFLCGRRLRTALRIETRIYLAVPTKATVATTKNLSPSSHDQEDFRPDRESRCLCVAFVFACDVGALRTGDRVIGG